MYLEIRMGCLGVKNFELFEPKGKFFFDYWVEKYASKMEKKEYKKNNQLTFAKHLTTTQHDNFTTRFRRKGTRLSL